MPVSPQEVEQLVDDSAVERLVERIDANLKNPRWVKEWRCGTPESPYWDMAFAGTLSTEEKRQLRQLYLDAGWREVHVRNSEEGGERPGMVGVALHR
ncbi:hypothetical protein D3C87_1354660 [compost metagenome]